MKKVLCLVFALILLLALPGCVNREKIAEKIIESAVQQQEGDVDVDIDDGGDSITISGEDGSYSVTAEEGMAWPDDKLPSYIPAIPGVIVSGAIDSGTGVTVVFNDCDAETVNAYIETLKNLDWKDTTNMNSEEGVLVLFEKSGETLVLTWDKEEDVGSITFGTP